MTDTRGFSTGLIFVPNCVSINDPAAGIPLKDGVGFLSLREEVDSSGKRLGYLYRFTSDEYIYLADKRSSSAGDWMKDGFFNFHYQNDPPLGSGSHDEPHISFLHGGIRYISRDIGLDEFLEFIEKTFFVDGARKQSLPWNSRF